MSIWAGIVSPARETAALAALPTARPPTSVRALVPNSRLVRDAARWARASGIPESDYGSITIRLYTEREPCESCSSVIEEFKKAFPGVKVNVSTSYR